MKKILWIFMLITRLFSFPAYSQQVEWENTIGGYSTDMFSSLTQTTDGGYVLGGYSSTEGFGGDKSEIGMGNFDFWVVKVNASGTILWDNVIGGAMNDELNSIAPTTDGGVICGGSSRSDMAPDKSENSIGLEDYWVVKLDASGNIQWENTIGGTAVDKLYAVQQTTDGGYIIGGYSSSYNNGDKTETNYGSGDIWILKLDSIGNIQWQNTIGGSDVDELYSLKQTSDGGFILGGTSESNISVDKTEDSQGLEDYWIIKLDAVGNIQWQNTIGGNAKDWVNSIEQTNDGGYICGGSSASDISGDKNEDHYGTNDQDFWIVKLDSTGNIEWQNNIGGYSWNYFNSIHQTFDYGYLCSGQIYGTGSDISDACYDIDYVVFKLDSIGNIQWLNALGSSISDFPSDAQITSDGGLICGGYSDSNIGCDKTENSLDNTLMVFDYWIVKLSGPANIISGIEFADMNSNGIKEPGEPALRNLRVYESVSGKFAFTNNKGEYFLPVADSGNYQINGTTNLDYYSPAPVSHAVSFPGSLQIDSLNNFAMQPTGTFNDLCVTITPSGPFRSGFQAAYKISYSNSGTTSLTPTIIFYPDSNIVFSSSDLTPTSVTSDSVIFQLPSIAPFQDGTFQIRVDVNIGLTIGTSIISESKILPIAGDANPFCNVSSYESYTSNAFDPNDISASRDTILSNELMSPPDIEYLIRFQNTGSDTAFYVRVDNKISGNLNLNSFEFIDASHSCNIEYQEYDSTLKFSFNNILLPDSNTNEMLSHGFVRYKIKPYSSLSAGDSILSSARITFDYNEPVLTNTAITRIILFTGVQQNNSKSNSISLYPNPAKGDITIALELNKPQQATIELFNLYGQKVRVLFNGYIAKDFWKNNFDISALPQGLYFISVSGEQNHFIKFIKE